MTNTTEQALRDAPSIPASKITGGLYTTRDVERMHLAWLNYFNEFRIAAALSLPPSEQEPVAFDYKQAIGSKNCMQCSVAYMLGLPVDSVPDFEEQSQRGIPSYDSMECFIESQGFGLVMLPGTSQPECDYLASGKTKRGTSHMVVMNSGHLVHDPHPSDDGLDAVSCIWLITRKAGCTTQTTNHAPTPHPAEVREVSVPDEVRDALQAGKHYAEEALSRHDESYGKHPATEPERRAIVEDIATIDAALAEKGGM